MSRTQSLDRINQGIRAVADQAPATPAASAEAGQLAREAIQAFSEELDMYRRLKDSEPNRLDPKESPEWMMQTILDRPPQDVTFYDIERLSRIDPARAVARWEEIKATARQDLASGYTAARALEYLGGSAWERANFLAIRERLFQAWSPRHAGEAMLLEEMAQYEAMRRQWVRILSLWSRDPRLQISLQDPTYQHSERRHLSHAQANLEAVRMVDRLQRLYQNALRTLLMSRRGKAAFIVQRSGQINVGAGSQCNAFIAPTENAVIVGQDDQPAT
jgi:hypothetical protein